MAKVNYHDGDGWHKANGLCCYIEGGLVRRYYEADDKHMKVIEMEKPCKLHALRVKRYRHRLKAERAEKAEKMNVKGE